MKAILGAGIFSLPWAVAQARRGPPGRRRSAPRPRFRPRLVRTSPAGTATGTRHAKRNAFFHASRQGGLVFVPLFIFAACLLSLHTLSFLVVAKRALLAENPKLGDKLSSYTGIVEAALGPLGGRAAEVMNLSCCFGICSAYLVFVGATLATVLGAPQNAMVWAITPPMVGLAWMRSMSGAAMIALVGNASVAAGIAFVCFVALQQPLQLAALPLANPAGFGSYFGSVAFLFFIHFTLPAIESSMAVPSAFMGATAKAFGVCAALGAAFGVVGAAAFGPAVSSVVITMLGETPAATAVKLLLSVNLMLTFPIVCRSAFLIVEGLAEKGGQALGTWQQRALRSAFVLAASLVATTIPSFGALLALVGGVSLSVISMVFPSAIVLFGRKADGSVLVPLPAAQRAAAALIMVAGLAIVVYTLVSAA